MYRIHKVKQVYDEGMYLARSSCKVQETPSSYDAVRLRSASPRAPGVPVRHGVSGLTSDSMAGRLTFFFEEKLLALYSYRLFGCTAIQTARQRSAITFLFHPCNLVNEVKGDSLSTCTKRRPQNGIYGLQAVGERTFRNQIRGLPSR